MDGEVCCTCAPCYREDMCFRTSCPTNQIKLYLFKHIVVHHSILWQFCAILKLPGGLTVLTCHFNLKGGVFFLVVFQLIQPNILDFLFNGMKINIIGRKICYFFWKSKGHLGGTKIDSKE